MTIRKPKQEPEDHWLSEARHHIHEEVHPMNDILQQIETILRHELRMLDIEESRITKTAAYIVQAITSEYELEKK